MVPDGYGLFVSPPIRLRALTRPSGPHLPTGRSAGGVPLNQTVGRSSDTSCRIADDSSMSSFFTLNPTIPSQFSLQTVTWEFHTIPGTSRYPRINPQWPAFYSRSSSVEVYDTNGTGTYIFEDAHKYCFSSSQQPRTRILWEMALQGRVRSSQSPAKVVKVTRVWIWIHPAQQSYQP